MRIGRLVWGSMACLLFVTLPGQAGFTLDQEQALGPSNISNFSNAGLAQSFQPSAATIAGAGLLAQSVLTVPSDPSVEATVTIALYDKVPNALGASKLTQGSATYANGYFPDPTWLQIAFDDVLVVTPGVTYFLDFSASLGTGIKTFYLKGSLNNPYNKGIAFAQFYDSGSSISYWPYTDYDYAFQTYSQSTIPVPGAFMLSVLGVGMVSGWRRRQI